MVFFPSYVFHEAALPVTARLWLQGTVTDLGDRDVPG